MIPLSTGEIAVLTGADAADGAGEVHGVSIDSRTVTPGDLFVALAGTRTDGAAYVDQALAAGAVAALVPRDQAGPRRIAVEDPLLALGEIAAEVRRRSEAVVIAVTGSTGKTSTKDILRALLIPHLATVASRENENNELGVPLTVCRVEPATGAVVAELAMRGLGQIAYLSRIVQPQIAIITGIGPVHLELLGSIENVAAAKAEVLADLEPGGTAVVPYGELLLAPHLGHRDIRLVTFGEQADADVRLDGLRRGSLNEGEAEITVHGRTISLPVNFTSHHNAVNLTAAVAAYEAAGLPLDDVGRGSDAVEFSRWRGETLELPGGGLLIADCYNANPTSMRAATRHLAEVADGRRTVAVLGDMAETGADAEEFHRALAQELRSLGIDQVIAIGPLSKAYGGDWFPDVDDAVDALPGLVEPGDAVLVKASRSIGLEAVVEALLP
jgi:UDP-N-acetylmuramoyl-tripeptide--D-alanyl-D-alanine ligase